MRDDFLLVVQGQGVVSYCFYGGVSKEFLEVYVGCRWTQLRQLLLRGLGMVVEEIEEGDIVEVQKLGLFRGRVGLGVRYFEFSFGFGS